jgi:HSP20 family protein
MKTRIPLAGTRFAFTRIEKGNGGKKMNPITLFRSSRHPLAQWQKDFDRFFEEAGWPVSKTSATSPTVFEPSCEVTEDKSNYFFKFDLPGMNKDQVKIEIHENQLTVSGERREEKKEDNKKYHFSEFSYGSFLRTFTLPANIDAEKVEAKFDNGVLAVTVGKTEMSKSRQINIR